MDETNDLNPIFIKKYNENDYSLLISSKQVQCPFCNEYLSEDMLEGHSKDCMMYEPPTIPIGVAIFIVGLFITAVIIICKRWFIKNNK